MARKAQLPAARTRLRSLIQRKKDNAEPLRTHALVLLMPEHLAAYPLETPLLDLLEELGKWLEDNGTFAPGIQNFEKCTNSDLTERVGQVWGKIFVLFAQIQSSSDTPKYWGISRSQRGGGWMTNTRGQLLVPIRRTKDSTPHIKQPNGTSTEFAPGNAVYIAPSKLAFISDDVEFFFVH